MASSIGLEAAALSDVGMRRTTNQDSHALLLADSLEVLQLTTGESLSTVLSTQLDNGTGRMSYAAGRAVDAPVR